MHQSTELTARHIARKHDLPAELVLAMIHVESAGNYWAHRIEPHYRWLWNVQDNGPYRPGDGAYSKTAPDDFPGGTFDTATGGVPVAISANSEWIAQQTSWGLLQLMGANARSLGFKLPLPALCDPVHGLEYGCLLLARYRDRWLADHGWAGVVDGWNDGNARIEYNPDYPHRVAAVSPEAAQLLELTP